MKKSTNLKLVQVMSALNKNRSPLLIDPIFLKSLKCFDVVRLSNSSLKNEWDIFDCIYFLTIYFFGLIEKAEQLSKNEQKNHVKNNLISFLRDSSFNKHAYFESLSLELSNFSLIDFLSYLLPEELLVESDRIKLINTAKKNTSYRVMSDFEDIRKDDLFNYRFPPFVEVSKWMIEPTRYYCSKKVFLSSTIKNKNLFFERQSSSFLELWESWLGDKRIEKAIPPIKCWTDQYRFYSSYKPEGISLDNTALLVCHFVLLNKKISFDKYKDIRGVEIAKSTFVKTISLINNTLKEVLDDNQFLISCNDGYQIARYIDSREQTRMKLIDMHNVKISIIDEIKKLKN